MEDTTQSPRKLLEFLELIEKEAEAFTDDDLVQALRLVDSLKEHTYSPIPSSISLMGQGVAHYRVYFTFSPLHIVILNGHYELARQIIERYPEALNHPLSRIDPLPQVLEKFSSAVMAQLADLIIEAGKLTQGMFIAQRCHVNFQSLSYLKFALGSIGNLGIDQAAIDLITTILKTPTPQQRLSEIADSNTLSSIFNFCGDPLNKDMRVLHTRSTHAYKTLFLGLLAKKTAEELEKRAPITIAMTILNNLADIRQGTFDVSYFLSNRLKLNPEKTALVFDVTPELAQLREREQASTAHQQVHGQPVVSQQELLARELAEKIAARREHAAGQEQASSMISGAASGSGIAPALHEYRASELQSQPSAPQNQPLLYGTPVAERTAHVEARIKRPAPPPPPKPKAVASPSADTAPTKTERPAPPPVPPRRPPATPSSPATTSAATFGAGASTQPTADAATRTTSPPKSP